jgi:hypothetical protein
MQPHRSVFCPRESVESRLQSVVRLLHYHLPSQQRPRSRRLRNPTPKQHQLRNMLPKRQRSSHHRCGDLLLRLSRKLCQQKSPKPGRYPPRANLNHFICLLRNIGRWPRVLSSQRPCIARGSNGFAMAYSSGIGQSRQRKRGRLRSARITRIRSRCKD